MLEALWLYVSHSHSQGFYICLGVRTLIQSLCVLWFQHKHPHLFATPLVGYYYGNIALINTKFPVLSCRDHHWLNLQNISTRNSLSFFKSAFFKCKIQAYIIIWLPQVSFCCGFYVLDSPSWSTTFINHFSPLRVTGESIHSCPCLRAIMTPLNSTGNHDRPHKDTMEESSQTHCLRRLYCIYIYINWEDMHLVIDIATLFLFSGELTVSI